MFWGVLGWWLYSGGLWIVFESFLGWFEVSAGVVLNFWLLMLGILAELPCWFMGLRFSDLIFAWMSWCTRFFVGICWILGTGDWTLNVVLVGCAVGCFGVDMVHALNLLVVGLGDFVVLGEQ